MEQSLSRECCVPQAIRDIQQKQQQQQQKQQQLLMLTQIGESERDAATKQLEPPPPKQYALQHPWIAPVDLDIIRCSAQFVARNGQKFLAGLAQREQQNPQFAFLKPSHHLFSYFASLVDAYTKCLLPQKETLDALKETAKDRQGLLTKVRRRMMYERQQLQQRKEKETRTQEERRVMMSLEWTDFHVVETIDFTEEDERLPLAAPIDFKSVPRELPKALLAESDGLGAGVTADGEGEAEGEKLDSIAKLIEGADAEDDDEAMETEDEEEPTNQQAETRQIDAEVAHDDDAPAPEPQEVVSISDSACAISRQPFIPNTHWKPLPLPHHFELSRDTCERRNRLEAEAEGDAVRVEPSSVGAHDSTPAPEAKRQRVEAPPSAAAASDGTPSLLLLTVVCREGEGLEAQEAQVEVDRSLTGAQLKQSLLDAGIGSEGLKARDLQLSTSANGQPVLVG
ncbi:hypothetical protein Emag_004920 [Eimeria magna]